MLDFLDRGSSSKPMTRLSSPLSSSPAGGIAGRVIDATGRPVSKALVGVQLTEYRTRILGGWGETQTDDQGRFAITGLEPGVYNLLFEEAQGRPKATARAVEGLRVQAGHNTAALMKVIEGRRLSGIVIDQATDQPVVGIQVGCDGRTTPIRSRRRFTQDRCDRPLHLSGPTRRTARLPDGRHLLQQVEQGTVDVPEEGEIAPVRLIRMSQSASSQSSQYTRKAAIRTSEPTKGEAKSKQKAQRGREQGSQGDPLIGTLTGRVRGPQGEPLAGVHVSVSPCMQTPNALKPEQFDSAITDRAAVSLFQGLERLFQFNFFRHGFLVEIESVAADKDKVEYTFQLKPDSSSKFRPVPKEDDPVPAERLKCFDLYRSVSLRQRALGRRPRLHEQRPESPDSRRPPDARSLLPNRRYDGTCPRPGAN